MIRFLLTVAANLVVAAVALLLTGWLLSEWVTLQVTGFLIAVAVFTLAQSLLTPVILSFARKYASAMLGGIGLVTTLLALWIATLLPGGLAIEGLGWILAPLLVWIVTALGGWILIGVILERRMRRREEEKLIKRASHQE